MINHQFKGKCKYNGCSCHQIRKFSPLAADAEKAEYQTQELIRRVAELQGRLILNLGCLFQGQGLNWEKKWDCESWDGDIWVNSLETLESSYFLEPSETPKVVHSLLAAGAPSLLEDNTPVSKLEKNVCSFNQDLSRTPPWTFRSRTRVKSPHNPAE